MIIEINPELKYSISDISEYLLNNEPYKLPLAIKFETTIYLKIRKLNTYLNEEIAQGYLCANKEERKTTIKEDFMVNHPVYGMLPGDREREVTEVTYTITGSELLKFIMKRQIAQAATATPQASQAPEPPPIAPATTQTPVPPPTTEEPRPIPGNTESQKAWMLWYIASKGLSETEQFKRGFKAEMKEAAKKHGISAAVIDDRWKELGLKSAHRTIKSPTSPI